ncbi:MAG: hypothetical protein D6775_06325 [Caldilineae bacterium]|nr:MAG: hypothetical protein D6775_06325 [Caldilineae bacterium]
MPPLRSAVFNLLLVVVSLCLSLLMVEGAVRALHLAPPPEPPGWFWRIPDPQTGWSLQPDSEGRWFNARYEYDVEVRINSQGLRDVERSGYEKPAGTYRILLIGDSFVEGIRVPLEQTFAKQLEAELKRAWTDEHAGPEGVKRPEVVNAGVGGWGTDQELLWYRAEGRKYDPDLVILAFFPANDFMNNSEELESSNMGRVLKPFFHLEGDQLTLRHYPYAPESNEKTQAADANARAPAPLTPVREWLHRHSALYRWLAPRIPSMDVRLAAKLVAWGLLERGQEVARAELGPDYVPVAYGVYHIPPAPAWQDTFRLTEALLDAFNRDVQDQGARLLVVILPSREQVYAEQWQRILAQYPAMRGQSWDVEQPNRLLHGMLERLGIPYLDMLPLFKAQVAAGAPPLYLQHDGHWTAAAEALAGRLVADFVRKQVDRN